MDIESVSSVKQNYNAAEAVKKASVHTESTQTAPVKEHPSAVMAEKAADKAAVEGQKEHKPSEATIDDAVRSANRRMEHTRCEYSYHKETNRVSIKVINDETDEVIREIPPEKSLDMLQKMWEMAGILVDQKR